ncbi:ATP-binding cassette domain-containing protein [Geminicoccus harenae]|uniref:ATP-binding cassette domain-containing protein n=3 Tax=Geminicoccus harenae TaxID=2498453 RepID=UPI001C947442|nr:ATP-binding cassette domain-containing protein [Geminicoccus harenae]
MTERLDLTGLRLEASGRVLVDDVALSLEAGKVLALVGASGSGKSLTTLALLDLLPPGVRRTGGRIILDGVAQDTAGLAALRGRTIGLVQQSPRSSFNPVVTIERHFRETLALAGLRRGAARARALELLAEVGFDRPAEIVGRYPFQLSGGMLQRVMIALALALDPRFLLADEPTTDLDTVLQAQVLDLLGRLRARRGLGILLVTHDLSVVARLADHVAVMAGGRMVEQAAVGELFHRPSQPVTRALLEAHLALCRDEPAGLAA